MADGKNLPVFTPFKKANLWVPDTLILNLRRRIRWDEEQGKLTTMQVTKLPGDKVLLFLILFYLNYEVESISFA